MRYSTIVEKDDKTLVEIIAALEQFEQDRFIAGIQARHYTKFDIEQSLDMVKSYQSRINVEARSLARFSETFIQQFATDNNACFNEAQRYFNRIRSTLSALKKVFLKTTPRSMAQLPEEFTAEDVMRCFGLATDNAARSKISNLLSDHQIEKSGEIKGKTRPKSKFRKTGIIVV